MKNGNLYFICYSANGRPITQSRKEYKTKQGALKAIDVIVDLSAAGIRDEVPDRRCHPPRHR